MKIKVLAFFMVLPCWAVQATAWAYLSSSASGYQSYALPASGSESFPIIWFKTTDSRGNTLNLSKNTIDCVKGMYSIKEISHYSISGEEIGSTSYFFNHWNEITPDSLASYEYKFACHKSLF